MRVPNWIHHSKKDPKRKLKPQALRQAKFRRQALKRKLKGAFLVLGINSKAFIFVNPNLICVDILTK